MHSIYRLTGHRIEFLINFFHVSITSQHDAGHADSRLDDCWDRVLLPTDEAIPQAARTRSSSIRI